MQGTKQNYYSLVETAIQNQAQEDSESHEQRFETLVSLFFQLETTPRFPTGTQPIVHWKRPKEFGTAKGAENFTFHPREARR